ncbi:Rv2175c family DNA-binding protein [uncultured Corynebacterium sp.]|uniref:Rv2175c family DNA-binding protein n=1 Tax=uncultured Corynebacterium sp. TaxID=159447 RepID=UPI0025F4E0AA|nr:Rv2175c family DNA-binding protein [uncultured Corynebacterium sp.]
MKSNSRTPDVLSASDIVLPISEVADYLHQPVSRVRDLINKGQLIAVNRDNQRQIPARFFNGLNDKGHPEPGERVTINKHVPGLIALMSDGGYSNDEILNYLFTDDETLPGRPIDALHGHLAREVMRRAQAMGF